MQTKQTDFLLSMAVKLLHDKLYYAVGFSKFVLNIRTCNRRNILATNQKQQQLVARLAYSPVFTGSK